MSKPSDTGSRGHSDPMDIDAVKLSLSRLAEEKGHRVRVMGVLSAVVHIFNETSMHARAQASNRLAKANRASHGPRVRAKARVKETKEIQRKIQRNQRCQRFAQGQNIENWSLSGLEKSKSEVSSVFHWIFLERWLEW